MSAEKPPRPNPPAKKLPVAKALPVVGTLFPASPESSLSGSQTGPVAREETRGSMTRAADLEAICDAFERGWKSGQRPAINELLRGKVGADRSTLFQYLLELELDYRRRAGEQPTLAAYVSTYPDFRPQVEQCFGSSAAVKSAVAKSVAKSPAVQPIEQLQRLGEYDLLEKIAEGGMGAVYKARHRRMNRIVALKVLSPRIVGTPTAVERFQREVQTISQLSHPHIVTAFDAGEDQGVHYLVMEFVEGKDLSAVLRERGPLPVAEALRWIQQTAEGLEYAHRKGIVHRDIKPGNLLLDAEGKIRILDMGLARTVNLNDAELQTELTAPQQMLGTVDYMSPEQAANSRNVDHRTDIYSLGCTLYRLLTNLSLYEGESAIERIMAHREQPIPSLREVRPEVPQTIEQLYRRMVAKKPGDRPATFREVIEIIQPALLQSRAAKPAPRARQKKRAVGLVPLAIGSGVLVLLVAVGAAFIFNRGKQEPRGKSNEVSKSQPLKTNRGIGTGLAKTVKEPPFAEYPLTADEAKSHQQAWADYLKVPLTVQSAAGQELILIPPGKFTPGSTAEQIKEAVAVGTAEELDSHYIDYIRAEADFKLKQIPTAFYLARTEVTVAQFRQFVTAKKYQTTAETNGIGGYHLQTRKQEPDANWKNNGMFQTDNDPVVEITVADALAFCDWLSEQDGAKYFLPTETQWEYACRAGTTTPWVCGNDPARLGDYAWYEENSEGTTHPVAQKLPNAFGLFDMHGNVREWTSSLGVSPDTHLIRGGEFLKPPVLLRSAMRIAFKAATPYPYHGFRIAREIKQ